MGVRKLEIKRSGGCGYSINTTGLAGSACGNVKIIALYGAAGIMVTTTVYKQMSTSEALSTGMDYLVTC